MGSFSRLTYHIVFATKYRKRSIADEFRQRLYEYLGGTLRAKKGQMIEVGGVEDHVHILATLSPALAVADVVRDVKANSSRWINEEFVPARDFQWQKGYGVFTLSYDKVPAVRRYIRNQKEHHRRRTFQEEYIAFLEKHDIDFRPEYLFEDEHHT